MFGKLSGWFDIAAAVLNYSSSVKPPLSEMNENSGHDGRYAIDLDNIQPGTRTKDKCPNHWNWGSENQENLFSSVSKRGLLPSAGDQSNVFFIMLSRL